MPNWPDLALDLSLYSVKMLWLGHTRQLLQQFDNIFRPNNGCQSHISANMVPKLHFDSKSETIFILSCARIKEYILVWEWTAPPCFFQTFAHPTSPCSVCSILQLPDCLTEQAGGEVGWANVWKTQGVLSVLLLIYILWKDP